MRLPFLRVSILALGMIVALPQAKLWSQQKTTHNLRSIADHPDGLPIRQFEPTGNVAQQGVGSGCDKLGDFVRVFEETNLFRGDMIRVEKSARLLEIQMELAFTGVETLYFSIHSAPTSVDAQPFVRVTDDVTVVATGAGAQTPTFYSSGLLVDPISGLDGILLEAGMDYAIGASWGATSIAYGRNQLVHPVPFSQGQVLGQVAVNFVTPPVDDTIPLLQVFDNGAYSMQLCFSGACCLGVDLCADVGERACLDAGGSFTAPGVTCADIAADPTLGGCPIPAYACCVPGTPCLDLNQFICTAGGGTSLDGILCDDPFAEACEPRGGCCLGSASCADDKTVNQCNLLGGTYRGDNVACSAFPPCGAGACCNGIACSFVLTETDCVDVAGGVFAGPGISCQPNPCAPTGACCRGDTCGDGEVEVDCVASGGAYRGDDTTCATLDVGCDLGACCHTNGCIDSVSLLTCDAIGGTFNGDGSSCATLATRCPGVCCWGANFCTLDITPDVCTDQLTGVFAGHGITCPVDAGDVDPCAGLTSVACCLSDETCVDTTAAVCTDTLQGIINSGVACSDNAALCVIPPATGACCESTGCTNNQTQAACTSASGQWFEGVGCSVGLCDPRGACCIRGTNQCIDNATEALCLAQPDQPEWTGGTTCDQLSPPCAPLGACCNSSTFVCFDNVVEAGCMGLNETWTLGTCASLNPPCAEPTGACCRSGDQVVDCAQETIAACEGTGGTYHGDGVTCAAAACGACCDLDGTCVDNGVIADCLTGTADFHPGLLCSNVCVPRGACCVGSTCTDGLALGECEAAFGTYDGDDTACTPGLCEIGACCSTSGGGVCVEGSTRQQCALDGGTALADVNCDTAQCVRGACCPSDGQLCRDAQVITDCSVPEDFLAGEACTACVPRGACCLPDASCNDLLSRAECLNLGGNYVGDTTMCTPADLCLIGACCDGSGTCDATLSRHACEAGSGTYAGAGVSCGDGCGVRSPIDSDPPNCAIDARQPTKPDGSRGGTDTLTMTFDLDAEGLASADFAVSLVPSGNISPSVFSVVPTADPKTVLLVFDFPFPELFWTCVRHVPSGVSTCIGALPADTGGDGLSDAADVVALLDCVSGTSTCQLWQCDLNRSGMCTPADMLRLIDLLNGAGAFTASDGATLPVCPSAR